METQAYQAILERRPAQIIPRLKEILAKPDPALGYNNGELRFWLGWAQELGPRGIRVNAINPGLVITEGVTTAGFDQSDFRKTLESQTPLGRIGQTEDIAPAAVFFASSDSKWITGETLLIAGGLR